LAVRCLIIWLAVKYPGSMSPESDGKFRYFLWNYLQKDRHTAINRHEHLDFILRGIMKKIHRLLSVTVLCAFVACVGTTRSGKKDATTPDSDITHADGGMGHKWPVQG